MNPNYVPNDGFGNPLVYESDGGSFRLRSLGADGAPGGAGLDADIEITNATAE